MTGALYAVVSGGLAAMERLEITTNNLANVNTAGFKAQQLLVEALEPGAIQTSGGYGTLVSTAGTTVPAIAYKTITDTSQGSVRESGNPLDVAITGPGFFALGTPNGERYTRQGQFHLSPTGVLLGPGGHAVLGQNGEEIRLPPGRIEIDDDGGILVDDDGVSLGDAPVGRLRLVRFDAPERLVPEGTALYAAPADMAPADVDAGETQLVPGSIELANVDAVQGLLELIDVARGYEAYMQAMRQVDGTIETAIQQVGGTT
jgi:flagellar basal-body rod protein FlgF